MPTSRTESWSPVSGWLRKPLIAAVLFWFFSYVLMSARGLLQPAPLPFFSERRLVSTLSGALLFGASAGWLLRRQSLRPVIKGIAIAAISTAAAFLLFGIQSLAEIVNDWHPRITASGQAAWLLMWAGYFAAWLTGVVAWGADPPAAPADTGEEKPSTQEEVLWVQRNRSTIRVPLTSVQWVEAEGNYARIHTAEGSGLLRGSLRSLEGRLAPLGFVRVHRSALCSKARVTGVRRDKTGMRVLLDGGAEVPVGRAFAQSVAEELQLSSH